MNLNFEVHESHLPLWEDTTWRYAFLMGGRGNGRSGTASRYTVSQLLSKEYTRGAVMRAVREDIRMSSWSELIDRINEGEVSDAFDITDMHIAHGLNSVHAHGFKASSGSLTARLKSLSGYNFIWIEEGEEIGEGEFTTLDDSLRTVKGRIRIIFSLNTPPKNHWIIKRFFDLEPAIFEGRQIEGFYRPKVKEGMNDILYIPGTFRENLPNLDSKTVERYQAYRQSKPSYYWHMIEGFSPETVTGRIYSNWKMIDEVPHEARLLGYGLDFGFDPDPAAVVAIYYHNGGYILDQKLYQTKLINEHLAITLNALPPAPVICDSAEPKSIAELDNYGINALPAEKGPDSVNFGIKHVQGLKVSYTKRSKDLYNEYENYAWKINKEGETVGIPDPSCADHLLDAVRYGLVTLIPKQSVSVTIHKPKWSGFNRK